MSAELACEPPEAARAQADQAMAVLMSMAVLADDPPATGCPDQPLPTPPAAQPPAARLPAGRRRAWLPGTWARLGTAAGWPVAAILVLQAALSLRLTWSDSASSGEVQALWAGRLELGHWLHGGALATPALSGQLPAAASYVSGVPGLYPPVGALASGIGGLAAARLLSLILMLGATLALHGVTRRVIDRRSAFFAAAVFAGLGGTALLGSLASAGAMSVALIALAAWLGIRAAERVGRGRAALAVAAGAALALANATAYGCAPADLIAVSVTALAIWRSCGPAAARRGAALMSAVPAVALAAAVAGGQARASGLLAGIAGRAAVMPSLRVAALAAVPWLGALAVLAAVGVLVQAAARQGWQLTAMSVLLAAGAAVPLASAGDPGATARFLPATCGAWFGCIVAGYAVASLARAVPRAKSAGAFGVGLGLAVLAAVPGLPWAARQVGWPQAGPVTAVMAAVLARHPGPVLSDDADLLHYYLGRDVAGRVLTGPARFRYHDPGVGWRTGAAADQDAVRHHYFGVIMLSLGPAAGPDRLERTIVLAGYQRVAVLPARAGGPAAAAGTSVNVWVRAGRP